jgi:hypothetical protein
MSTTSGDAGVPLGSRLRPWVWLLAALLAGGSILAYVLGDRSASLYSGAGGLALVISNLLTVFVSWYGRTQLQRAGADHAIPSWRTSNAWTAPTFDVNRRDYDPDGVAWAELVVIARSHGYSLDPDTGRGDSAWRFVRDADPPTPARDVPPH